VNTPKKQISHLEFHNFCGYIRGWIGPIRQSLTTKSLSQAFLFADGDFTTIFLEVQTLWQHSWIQKPCDKGSRGKSWLEWSLIFHPVKIYCPIYKCNTKTKSLISEYWILLLEVNTSLFSVLFYIAMCFSNEITIIKKILSLLRSKKIILYTEV
jgi:hypothetical protein